MIQPFAQNTLDRLWATYTPADTTKGSLLQPEYLLAAEGPYKVYFAPLGVVPEATARVVLLGLTPGLAQTQLAAKTFLNASPEVRADTIEFGRRLRREVAFGGSMRDLLCRMLDEIDLPRLLGLSRSQEIFAADGDDVATTSALVYPVFTGPTLKNFGGSADLARVELFREMLTTLLAPRLAAAPRALIIPFGKAASTGVRFLVEQNAVDEAQVLWEFPHPSGANGHRVRQFAQAKAGLRSRAVAWAMASWPKGR